MTSVQPLVVNAADVSTLLARLWWPVLRIGGFVLTAPIASETTIPGLIKLVFTVGLAFVLAPLAPVPAELSIFSGAGAVTAVQELLIGIAIGMVVQLIFDALTFAGQTISMTMGLGFATLIDPQHNDSVPVIGQILTIMGTLTYLSMNGHLVLLAALANSFQTLPIGTASVDKHFLITVATWGGRIFETGMAVALPAVITLVIVNMALGVVMRAAPQLNLFGIGFIITMAAGFFALVVGVEGMMSGILSLIEGALAAVRDMLGGAAAGAH
jgi:flagellar biosynthetic protein FliR